MSACSYGDKTFYLVSSDFFFFTSKETQTRQIVQIFKVNLDLLTLKHVQFDGLPFEID